MVQIVDNAAAGKGNAAKLSCVWLWLIASKLESMLTLTVHAFGVFLKYFL
jgi:hypothetical protein